MFVCACFGTHSESWSPCTACLQWPPHIEQPCLGTSDLQVSKDEKQRVFVPSIETLAVYTVQYTHSHVLSVLHTHINTDQPFISGVDDCVEHGLIKKAIAHPLWDDNVHLIYRQLCLFHFPFKDGYNWNTDK